MVGEIDIARCLLKAPYKIYKYSLNQKATTWTNSPRRNTRNNRTYIKSIGNPITNGQWPGGGLCDSRKVNKF